jgi:hypothetical protein
MPKPIQDFTTIVENTVFEVFRLKFKTTTHENQIEKGAKFLSKQIKASFEDI